MTFCCGRVQFVTLLAACAFSCAGGQRAADAQIVQPEVRLLESPGDEQSEPDVLIDGDRVLVTFYGGVYPFFQSNASAYSADGGVTWGTEVGLPRLAGSLVDPEGQTSVCLISSGEFLCVQGAANGRTLAVVRGVASLQGVMWQLRAEPTPRILSGVCPPYDSPRIVHDATSGVTYLTYTIGLQVAAGVCENRIELMRSLDEGLTWSAPLPINDPARAASQGAQPVVGPDGELLVVWRDFGTSDVRMRRSDDLGVTFGPETVVASVRENQSAAPAWSGRRRHPVRWGDEHWMSDFPTVAMDRSIGPRRGSLYVAWAEGPAYALGPATGTTFDSGPNDTPESAQTFALGHDLVGFVSGSQTDADCDYFGFEGIAGQVVHLSGGLTFVSPTPGGTGPGGPSFQLMFRDPASGSYTAVAGHTMPFLGGYPAGGPIVITLPYTGRYVICAACGVFYSLGYEIRTRLVTMQLGSLARDHRDLVMVSSSDRGASWTPKRRLGDAPPGFDESLPALAVDEAGRLHAAWYDRREGGPRGLNVDTRWALSLDGGMSWLPSVRLNGASGTWLSYGGTRSNIGDRIALAAAGGRAHVVWVDGRGVDGPFDDYELYTARVDLGTVGIAVPRFVAEGETEGVRVRWTVADAQGVSGFRVHREGTGVVATVAASGEREYDVLDASAPAGEASRYRLEVQRGMASEWIGPVEAARIELVRELAWSRVGPSPFSERVSLTLALPREGSVTVRVYDLAGKEVARLHEGRLQAGSHAFTWGGESSGRGRAAAGVYLVRARSDEGEVVRRVIRVE